MPLILNHRNYERISTYKRHWEATITRWSVALPLFIAHGIRWTINTLLPPPELYSREMITSVTLSARLRCMCIFWCLFQVVEDNHLQSRLLSEVFVAVPHRQIAIGDAGVQNLEFTSQRRVASSVLSAVGSGKTSRIYYCCHSTHMLMPSICHWSCSSHLYSFRLIFSLGTALCA